MLLDDQNPLRRGALVTIESEEQSWVPFKYENLSAFCFGCGRMRHVLKDCPEVDDSVKSLSKDDYSFSIALKAKLNLVGKISRKLGIVRKKMMTQCSYLSNSSPGNGNIVLPNSGIVHGGTTTDVVAISTGDEKEVEEVNLVSNCLVRYSLGTEFGESLDGLQIPRFEEFELFTVTVKQVFRDCVNP